MSEKIKIPILRPGTYRHNKSGNLYQVIGVALDTETDTPLAVYKPLYEHEFGYELFTRPYAAFVETVKLDGKMKPRFEYIDG